MDALLLKEKIINGEFDSTFRNLYSDSKIETARARYIKAIDSFLSLYESRDIRIMSVPGRSEILGNHTDHNNGRVLAAAINLDIIAVVSENAESRIRIKSEGFDPDEIELGDLGKREEEKYTSASIIRGTAYRFKELGHKIGGFDAYTTSDILKGSGLSSSAAFEVMTGFILSVLYNGGSVSPVELAKTGQYAENEYFGKPCGLMDQTACACGGFVEIDFADTSNPAVEKLDFNLNGAGYNLCIVSTGGSHADLNEEYASITREMKCSAEYFGQKTLRSVEKSEFMKKINEVRERFGDRAALRCLHFFNENERVKAGADSLREGDFDAFLANVTDSGNSSYKYLQNLYAGDPKYQSLCVAIAFSEDALKGKRAAVRVHGGGFAGTIQAFIPKAHSKDYTASLEFVFGADSCLELTVRSEGAAEVTA